MRVHLHESPLGITLIDGAIEFFQQCAKWLPIGGYGIKSILEEELLYAGACHEIDKVFRDTQGRLPTGPYNGFSKLDCRICSGRGFIDDAQLPTVDCIDAIDDSHFCLSRMNQINDIFAMLCMEKVETAAIHGVKLCESPGRDLSQGRRLEDRRGQSGRPRFVRTRRERTPVLRESSLT